MPRAQDFPARFAHPAAAWLAEVSIVRARGQARAASAWAHALAPGPEELEALREGARLSVSTGTVEWTNKWRVPPERLRRELDFAAHAAAAIERL